MMIRFMVLFGVVVALAAVLWWFYPTLRGLPDAGPLEAKCKAVRERADIQAGLSRLHAIDESLAKLNVEHARTKKLNARTPTDLGGPDQSRRGTTTGSFQRENQPPRWPPMLGRCISCRTALSGTLGRR